MKEEMTTINDSLLDKQVYLNTRVSLRTRAKIDRYLQYMGRSANERPKETETWPSTVTSLVETAVLEWLARHPMKDRPGPDTAPVIAVRKTPRKSRSTVKEDG